MKKASLIVPKSYNKNKIFDINNKDLNRDNCLLHYFHLKEELKKNNIDLSTDDINSPEESQYIIYIDIYDKLPSDNEVNKSFLILFESDIIISKNWNLKLHKKFSKIFTWDDRFVDNKKYFKINFPQFIFYENKIPFNDKKFCTLISGNKTSSHKFELYSEREKAISWFEEKKPDEFEFYGKGWNEYRKNKKYKLLNSFIKRSSFLKKLFTKKYKTYKGLVESKNKVLQQYKFSICYENAKNVDGYITEKIFDSFFAGCIPIYLGPPNIDIHIPSNCYINKNDFKNYDDLYSFLKRISEEEYLVYIKNIQDFIYSNKIEQFTIEFFVKQVLRNIR